MAVIGFDPMATRDIPLFMKEMFLDVGWRCFSWLLRGDLWFGFLSNPMALLYRTCHECNVSGVLFRRGQFMSLSFLNSFFNSFLNLVDHYSGISKKLYCVSYIILSSLQPMENHKHSEHTFVIEPKLTASSVVCLDACRCTPPTSTWAFSKAPHQSATGCGQMFGVWPKLYPLELVTCPVLNRLPALDRLSRNTRTPGESRDVLV